MKKSVKINFHKQFVQLWKEGWLDKWFSIGKVEGDYLIDNDYLIPNISHTGFITYKIANQDAWNRLLDEYSDVVRRLEYDKRYEILYRKSQEKYLKLIEVYLYKQYGLNLVNPELHSNGFNIAIGNDQYVHEDHYSIYAEKIRSPEELYDFVEHYNFCEKIQQELNTLYQDFLKELRFETKKLGEKPE